MISIVAKLDWKSRLSAASYNTTSIWSGFAIRCGTIENKIIIIKANKPISNKREKAEKL